jgi:hypothetical protein
MTTNNNDFNEFNDLTPADNSSYQRKLLLKLNNQVTAELPHISEVILLIGLTHIIASFISLALCPQFGVRLFFQSAGLDSYFMPLGHEACFFMCGFIYLGGTFFLASLIFPTDAWIVLKQSRFLIITAFGLISMGTLTMIGHSASIELSTIWFLGSYLGASISLRLKNFRHKAYS